MKYAPTPVLSRAQPNGKAFGSPRRPLPNPWVSGRLIQPIEVIEGWVLCHHLGWAVQYLACAAYPNPFLAPANLNPTPLAQARRRLAYLKKAAAYLERELAQFPKCARIPMESRSVTAWEVIEDWGLCFHLGEVLYYIKAYQSAYRRKDSLERALRHLKIAIEHGEAEIWTKEPLIPEISNAEHNGGK